MDMDEYIQEPAWEDLNTLHAGMTPQARPMSISLCPTHQSSQKSTLRSFSCAMICCLSLSKQKKLPSSVVLKTQKSRCSGAVAFLAKPTGNEQKKTDMSFWRGSKCPIWPFSYSIRCFSCYTICCAILSSFHSSRCLRMELDTNLQGRAPTHPPWHGIFTITPTSLSDRAANTLVASLLLAVRPGAPSSFLFLVAMPLLPVASMLLVAMPFVTPGATFVASDRS